MNHEITHYTTPAITKHLNNIFKSGELEGKRLVPFWNMPLNMMQLREKQDE